jgi:periplasmic divalent cation tolerance protein
VFRKYDESNLWDYFSHNCFRTGSRESCTDTCGNFFPIQSVYVWQGEVCHEPEWQLVIKTNLQHFSVIEAKIRSLHSYEVPEIVALSITNGSQPYLNWISEQIQ